MKQELLKNNLANVSRETFAIKVFMYWRKFDSMLVLV